MIIFGYSYCYHYRDVLIVFIILILSLINMFTASIIIVFICRRVHVLCVDSICALFSCLYHRFHINACIRVSHIGTDARFTRQLILIEDSNKAIKVNNSRTFKQIEDTRHEGRDLHNQTRAD